MASIVLTGLAANDPVPGAYVEINFAQGNAAGSSSPRSILLIGNKTSAGSATTATVVYGPDTPVPAQTEADWIALFGAGSEMHRAYRRATSVNRDTAIYGICPAASGGTSASGTIVLANNATGNGNLRTWVGDESVDTAIASGDTPTQIGDALVTNINAMTHWPVTAANASGTVTLTAKIAGPRGNFIRYMTLITSGIATTATAGTDTALASGATADSSTATLATLLARKFYYIVSAAEDATQLGALVSQVNTQASPTTGIRQRVFAGAVGTLAATNTVATGINAARCEITWQKNSDWTPFELAAHNAAVFALFENSGSKPRNNYSGFGNAANEQAYWKVPAQRDASIWPTRTDIKSALNNGASPVGVNGNGSTYLVKRVTSRSLSGAVADYRIRDAHKVTICDFFADDAIAKTTLQFSGKDLADDPPQGAPPPDKQVVTPGAYGGALKKLVSDYGDLFLLQRVEQIKADMIVQRETSPTSRISARIPLQPCDIADQFALSIDQVA